MSCIRTTVAVARKLQDEDGASFLEYSVLLGMILGVSVAVMFALGGWAGALWSGICDNLVAVAGAAACVKP